MKKEEIQRAQCCANCKNWSLHFEECGMEMVGICNLKACDPGPDFPETDAINVCEYFSFNEDKKIKIKDVVENQLCYIRDGLIKGFTNKE